MGTRRLKIDWPRSTYAATAKNNEIEYIATQSSNQTEQRRFSYSNELWLNLNVGFLDNGISASSILTGGQAPGMFRLFTRTTFFSNWYPFSLCQLTFIPFHSNSLSSGHHSYRHSHPSWTLGVSRFPIELLNSRPVLLGPKPLCPSRSLWARINSGQIQTWNTTRAIASCLRALEVCLVTSECLAFRPGVWNIQMDHSPYHRRTCPKISVGHTVKSGIHNVISHWPSPNP